MSGPGQGMHVALFATCINDTLAPQIPRATVAVLERLGCTVHFPTAQACCGQMHTNSGYYDEAVPMVRSYVDAFGGFDYVVSPSGSCVGSVRHQHPMVAAHAGDSGLQRAAEAISSRTYEFTEFLVGVLGVEDVGAYFPHRVTYHASCHALRIAHVGDRPQRLLRAVRGIDFVELPGTAQCCGFGGTFSLKNPDVSIAMAADRARAVRSTDAEYVVSTDQACLLNIGGTLHRQRSGVRTMHLAEVLAHTTEVA